MKTAVVIGATGLIGHLLTNKLLSDKRYAVVKIFVRKTLGVVDPKLEEHLVDFDSIGTWKDKITGDELFSAMGTTIKKAGSRETQFKIDFLYQYETAKAAADNGVEKYILVSSAGANPKSKYFYTRIKGELEKNITKLVFKKIFIIQPSILVGERKEKRGGEIVGISVMKALTKIFPFLKKYRPIEAGTVADAMINCANDITHERVMIYSLNHIFQIAE